jgi:hypothetical protein
MNLRQSSRVEWSANSSPTIQQIDSGCLQRIADAMEGIHSQLISLNTKLDCHRVRGALDAIIRTDKRLAKKRPLR